MPTEKQTQKQKPANVRTLVLVGLMSAVVFALSRVVSIPIGTISRIHFGNIACLLSGLLFGPLVGGLSAGIGSMLYDFTDPAFVPEFWITFLMKFAMGFLAGWLNRYGLVRLHEKLRVLLSALCASLCYTTLFLTKTLLWQHYVNLTPWRGAWLVLGPAAVSSLLNGITAVLAAVALALALRPALAAAGLFRPPAKKGGGA